MEEAYKKQVSLLLDVLPEIAKESCLAMHGGTAINLFVRNMPRLSVDIDLTYVPIENRPTSLTGINNALLRVKNRFEKIKPGVRIKHREDVCNLDKAMFELEFVGEGIFFCRTI